MKATNIKTQIYIGFFLLSNKIIIQKKSKTFGKIKLILIKQLLW